MQKTAVWQTSAVVAVFGLLLFFSLYKLTEAPPIWYDEGIYTQVAMNIESTGRQVIQVAPGVGLPTSYLTVGYPVFLPVSLSYHLFGVGVPQGRAVMVLYIVAVGLLAYALIRRLYGEHSALLALFLLATFPMLYGNGKTVIGEVPGLFFVLCSLYALVRLEKTDYRDWRWYITLGISVGLCVATKPIFLLLPVALILTYMMRRKDISLSYQGLIAGVIGFLVPFAAWVYTQFGSDASLQAIFSLYANPSAGNIQNFFFVNIHRFVSESTPLYLAALLILWGVAFFVRRETKKSSSVEIAAFVFCLLVILAYLRIEGWYRYIFPAFIVALPFFPAAVMSVYEAFGRFVPSSKKITVIPIAFLVMISLGQLYQTARTSFVARYYDSTKTHDLKLALAEIDPKKNVFLYNAPDVAIFLPSSNYRQYLKLSATRSMGVEQLSFLTQGSSDIIIANDEDYAQRSQLFARYKVLKIVGPYDFLIKK